METYFSVRPEVSKSLILHRLGYHNRSTLFSQEQRAAFEALIDDYYELLLPDVTFDIANITAIEEGLVRCGTVTIEGKSAQKLLSNSSKVLLAASTAPGASSLTRQAFEQGRGDLAVIIDAVAGSCADAGLDWIGRLVSSRLTRQGGKLTMRYSPGYGDVPLSVQCEIFKGLDLSRLGLSLTGAGMLNPEKSVISFQGIELA